MRWQRIPPVMAFATMAIATLGPSTAFADAAPGRCSIVIASRGGAGSFVFGGTRECSVPPAGGSGGPVFRTIDCGPATVDLPAATPGHDCSLITALCRLSPGQSPPPNTTTTITLEQLPSGAWKVIGHDCAAPAGTGSSPLATAARAEAQRLVPRPGIGVGPPGGVTLVNIQTLFWLTTPATQSLGSVQLLGQTVELQVSIADISWNFGDGHTDHTTDPGVPYSSANPCHTAQCPGYYGHTYTDTGAVTVTATTTWTGRYRTAGGAWQPIPGTVTGTPSTLNLTVRQARGILVPDPN